MAERESAASLALPCPHGSKPHDMRDHDGRGLPHNPWSSGCIKNLLGEPTCELVFCPTCEGEDIHGTPATPLPDEQPKARLPESEPS